MKMRLKKKSHKYNKDRSRPGHSHDYTKYKMCLNLMIAVCVTLNVMKLVIMHISQLLCIVSSPIGKSDEKRKFYQVFRLFCIIFMFNGEFDYQIDYLS